MSIKAGEGQFKAPTRSLDSSVFRSQSFHYPSLSASRSAGASRMPTVEMASD